MHRHNDQYYSHQPDRVNNYPSSYIVLSNSTDRIDNQLIQAPARTGQSGTAHSRTKPLFSRLCIFFTVFSIMFFHSFFAQAGDITAVISLNIKPYNDALAGFESACNCKVKKIIVPEMKGINIRKKLHKEKPGLILAIGMSALNRVKDIKNIPVVSVMTLNPESTASGRGNISGVSMNIDPAKQFSVLREVLPGVKKIGVLYDPAQTGGFVKDAELSSASAGFRLIRKEMRSSKDVPSVLKNMKGKIDALWMIPDLTVVTPETVEFILLYSIENQIPVITFSDKYLEMGALISLEINAHDIGKQAGEIAGKVLSGTEIKHIPMIYSRKADVKINWKTAEKMGITVNRKEDN